MKHDEETKKAKKLTQATVDSINGWKAIAVEKMTKMAATNHPLGWRHGAEIVMAVAELEEAYLNILAMMERHFEEMDTFPGKPPKTNNN